MSEHSLAPSWEGSVVLDIGGDVGALVLRTPSTMVGREIDLTPEDAADPRTHSAVRERRLSSGTSYAAVYPSLSAGLYTVEGSGQRVTIIGGSVTDVEFSHDEITSKIK
jgi:hypothetical protein